MRKINITNQVPSVYVPSVTKKTFTKIQNALNAAADGKVFQSVTASATTHIAQGADTVIFADVSGGAKTITLPAAAVTDDKVFIVKKTDTSGNNLVINATSGNVEGGSFTITASRGFAGFASDGTNYWRVV